MHELLHREMRELGALGIALVVVCDLALEQLSTCQHRRGAHPNIIEALSPQQHRENAVESTRLRRLRPLRRMGEAKRSPGRRSTPRHALACDGCECAPQPPRSAGTPAPRHRCQGPGGMARCWAQPRVPRSACSQHGSPAHTDGRQRGDDAQAQGMRPGAVFWLQCPAGDSEAGRPASSAAQWRIAHRPASCRTGTPCFARTHARRAGRRAGRACGAVGRHLLEDGSGGGDGGGAPLGAERGAGAAQHREQLLHLARGAGCPHLTQLVDLGLQAAAGGRPMMISMMMVDAAMTRQTGQPVRRSCHPPPHIHSH
jgi:hypothetical protein